MALKDRIIEIVYDLKDKFTKKVGAITGGMREIEKSSDTSTARLEANNNRLVGSYGTIGGALSKISLALVVFGATVGKVVAGVKDWIAAANIQERAEVKLETSLRNLAGASDEQIQSLKDQASALQELTGFGDEQTISAQAMLATFRLNAEQIAILTPGLLDMAESARKAGNSSVDLETISIALGKAFTSGIGSLSRYGVAMDDTQKEAFKLADTQGKVSILAEVLDGNFQGLAQAVGETYEGAVRKAEAAQGDFSETLGQLFTESRDWIKLNASLTKSWKTLSEGIEGSTSNIALVISAIAKSLALSSFVIRSLFNEITIIFRIAAASITESIASITNALSFLTFGEASQRLRQFAQDMRGTTREILKGVGGDFDDIEDSYRDLLLAFEDGDRRIKQNATGMNELGAETGETAEKTDSLAKTTKDLADSLESAKSAAKTETEELNKAGEEADKTRERFRKLAEVLTDSGPQTEGFTLLNAVDALSEARERLRDGDFTGAITDAERIGKILLDIKESGAAADITVADLSRQLTDLVNKATGGQVSQELVGAEGALAEVERVKQAILEATGKPVDIKLKVDTSQIDALREIQPIVIPIRYEVIGGVPTAGDGTTTTDDLRNESNKKGFRP